MLDLRVIFLPTDNLHQRLSHLSFEAYYPNLETQLPKKFENECREECSLPLIIREKDTEYQFHRIILYHRLLLVRTFCWEWMWDVLNSSKTQFAFRDIRSRKALLLKKLKRTCHHFSGGTFGHLYWALLVILKVYMNRLIKRLRYQQIDR